MSTRLKFLTGAMALLSLIACKTFGSSKNEPPMGSVDRRYSKTPDEITQAVTEALEELNIPIHSETHDALGGQVKAQRANASEDEVVVWYQSQDARTTQVSVAVGKNDRRVATLIQDQIAQKLGAASAKSVPPISAQVDGRYDQNLTQCMAAAEQAMKDLKMDVTHKEVHDTWAQIESRQPDSPPLVVRMSRTDTDKTQVTFAAGSARSQDTEQFAGRLKTEFERVLGSAK